MGANRLFGVDVISACGVSKGCSVPCTRVQCDLGKVFNTIAALNHLSSCDSLARCTTTSLAQNVGLVFLPV